MSDCIIEPGELETFTPNPARFVTYYYINIPTRLLKPRDSITQCVAIEHADPSPPDSALAQALRHLIGWAEDHTDCPHPMLPGEFTGTSYLPAPVVMQGTVGEVLDQLMAMHVRVRTITIPKDVRFPALTFAKELFKSKTTFESFGVNA